MKSDADYPVSLGSRFMAKPKYRKSKEERKAWWNSLSPHEKAAYTEKWEHKRDVEDRTELELTPLTPEQMQEINDTMRRLGLEAHIVLPDMPERVEAEQQQAIATELGWIQ